MHDPASIGQILREETRRLPWYLLQLLLMRFFFKFIFRAIRLPFLILIKLYQKTLSPDHGWLRALFPGGYCKFTPSCSEYTRRAIEKRGLVIGGALGLWRIIRCNPCSMGGTDEP